MEQMLIVDAETIKAIKQKLTDAAGFQEARAAIKKIIEIKQTLLWRADAGTCCGSLNNIATSLTCEIGILEGALNALGKGNTAEAVRSLEEYERLLESTNTSSEPKSG